MGVLWSRGEDGNAVLDDEPDAPGSQPLVGALVYLAGNAVLGVTGTVPFDLASYDTDGFLIEDGYLEIPAGKAGIYLMETVIYVAQDPDVITRVNGQINEESGSCTFSCIDRYGSAWAGNGAYVRPLTEGEQVYVTTFAEGSDTPTVYGGIGSSMLSITKIAPLPDGWVSFF